MSLIRRAIPGLAALRSYQRGWLTPDLLAGVTVWAVLEPQAMGYASLAGVPAVYGLNIEGSILVPTFEGRMISFTGAIPSY